MRVSWLTEPDAEWDEGAAPPRGNRLKMVAAVLAGWLAVSLIVLVGLLRFGDRDSPGKQAGSPVPRATSTAAPTAATSRPAGSASSVATGAIPVGWVRRAADDQADCTAHSYGQVLIFFTRTPCSTVRRSLLTTKRDGRGIVVATSAVTFRTPAQATSYLRLVTSDGTGNINDLLREGVRYPGSPSKLPGAAFASRQDGLRVLVAEAAYEQGSSDYRDPTLQATARTAVEVG
ncbi:MAG: hypothetical protein QOE53_110 [Pseudonocardiales bacterium]|nr:hypothetical protein [Pseudonocardiales bacterium]